MAARAVVDEEHLAVRGVLGRVVPALRDVEDALQVEDGLLVVVRRRGRGHRHCGVAVRGGIGNPLQRRRLYRGIVELRTPVVVVLLGLGLGLVGGRHDALHVRDEVGDALGVQHALAAGDAPRGHRRAGTAVRDDVGELGLRVAQPGELEARGSPRDLRRQAVRLRGHEIGVDHLLRVAARVLALHHELRRAAPAVRAVTVGAQEGLGRVVDGRVLVGEQHRAPLFGAVLERLRRIGTAERLPDEVGDERHHRDHQRDRAPRRAPARGAGPRARRRRRRARGSVAASFPGCAAGSRTGRR